VNEGRTIRNNPTEPPVAHCAIRTIRMGLTYRPCMADRPTLPGGPSENQLPTKASHSIDRTSRAQEHDEHATNVGNNWMKSSLRTVRMGLVDCPPRAQTAAELDHLKVNPPFLSPNISNRPRESYQITAEGEAPLGDAILMNLEPKIH
jgi:hypothetical protein